MEHEHFEQTDGGIAGVRHGDQMSSLIAVNLVSILHPVVRETAWRVYGPRFPVLCPVSGRRWHPAVLIDGGPYEPGSQAATAPRVVFDIVGLGDDRVEEFATLGSLLQYVAIRPDVISVLSWRRNQQGELAYERPLSGPGEVLFVEGLSKEIVLSDIYRDTNLTWAPR